MSLSTSRVSRVLLAAPLALACLLPCRAAAGPKEPEAGRIVPAADRYGDPLPEGALARVGTVRFRPDQFTSRLAFSPDGKVLASGGSAGVCLWDAATGRPLHRSRGPRSVTSLAFSPDGKTLFVGDSLRLLDVATGRELRRFPAQGGYELVAFAPDGRVVATAVEDDLFFRDVATGNEVFRRRSGEGVVRALTFAPDSKILAYAGDDRTVRLLDVASGTERHRLAGHDAPAWAVAFAPDGKVLASAGEDRVVRLWDTAAGKELRRLRGHADRVQTLAFAPDGRALASAGNDGTVRLWEVTTGKELRQWQASAVRVWSVAFSPDGRTLASAGPWDHAIRLWDPATGQELRPAAGHTGLVDGLRFTPDGKALLSCGQDNRVLTWDLATAAERRRLVAEPPDYKWASAAAFSPDGKVLARTYWVPRGEQADPLIRLWDPASGKELRALSKHRKQVPLLAFSGDSKRLASAGTDHVICLWEPATGRLLRQWEEPLVGIRSLALSPDGKVLAMTNSQGTTRLWDVATGKELRHWEQEPEDSVSLAFAPDGKVLALAGNGGLYLWDVSTGKEVGRVTGPASPQALAFSPSGRAVAIHEAFSRPRPDGGNDFFHTIRVFERATSQEVRRIDVAQSGIRSLAFALDGRALATGGDDSTILLWDLTGRPRTGRLSAAELDKLWTELGGQAAPADRAGWSLAAVPDQAVPLLRERLRPVSAPDPKRVARLIADLDSDDFAVRDRAARDLARLEDLARPALTKALADGPSPEVRRRLGELLERLDGPVTGAEALRGLRAVDVLERIGTPEARQVLATLTTGTPDARLTQEAKASLQRLACTP